MSGRPCELLEQDTRTTAEYRKLADEYEDRLAWGSAALALEEAIRRYPKEMRGQLADADLAAMTARAKRFAQWHYDNHHDKGKTVDGKRCCTALHPLGWTTLLILD